MAGTKRVSFKQLEVLWEFLNSNKDLAMGYNKSTQAREMSRRLWMDIAQALNAIDGAHKSSKAWAAYWVDYKGKLKRKRAALRLSQSRTSGGQTDNIGLNDIEKKYLLILGEGNGTSLPDIQGDPMDTDSTSASTSSSSQDTDSILRILPEAEASEEIGSSLLHLGEEAVSMQPDPLKSESILPAAAVPESRPARSAGGALRVRRLGRRPMSQSEARRAIVESSNLRAEATQNINNTLISVLNVLTKIALSLERLEQRL